MKSKPMPMMDGKQLRFKVTSITIYEFNNKGHCVRQHVLGGLTPPPELVVYTDGTEIFSDVLPHLVHTLFHQGEFSLNEDTVAIHTITNTYKGKPVSCLIYRDELER